MEEAEIHCFPDTESFASIPRLQHGLESALDGKLVVGSMGLRPIPEVPPEDIALFDSYVPPAFDQALHQMAEREKCQFISSTSNISAALTHCYFVVSNWRRPSFEQIFEQSHFNFSEQFMVSFRKPALIELSRPSEHVYSVDSEKGFFRNMPNDVLLRFGKIGEFYFTNPYQTIEKMLETRQKANVPNYYRFSRLNRELLLRSQIDCRARRSNGQDYVFELKTRASCPIRYDIANWREYLDYSITTKRGRYESFEREYYDLVRGGFLKYTFQLKIGNMDGAFIAYHNTKDIFGFEYITLNEMALRLYGDLFNLDIALMMGGKILTTVLKKILELHPINISEKTRVGLYASGMFRKLVVLVEPLEQLKEYPLEEDEMFIQDYYDKHFPELPNRVWKYEFTFRIRVNGLPLLSAAQFYTEKDFIEMDYSFEKVGLVTRFEFIDFLHEAYKQEYQTGSGRFDGAWPFEAYEEEEYARIKSYREKRLGSHSSFKMSSNEKALQVLNTVLDRKT